MLKISIPCQTKTLAIEVASPETIMNVNRSCTGKAKTYAGTPKVVIRQLGECHNISEGSTSVPVGSGEGIEVT